MQGKIYFGIFVFEYSQFNGLQIIRKSAKNKQEGVNDLLLAKFDILFVKMPKVQL
jgi:hypothetical protein